MEQLHRLNTAEKSVEWYSQKYLKGVLIQAHPCTNAASVSPLLAAPPHPSNTEVISIRQHRQLLTWRESGNFHRVGQSDGSAERRVAVCALSRSPASVDRSAAPVSRRVATLGTHSRDHVTSPPVTALLSSHLVHPNNTPSITLADSKYSPPIPASSVCLGFPRFYFHAYVDRDH
ncbi:hypothetical protein J6590_008753 [Homalodisca vitripennis]|nr:hypothetical protein J6590_008753 [Homalodisca vitripennis]